MEESSLLLDLVEKASKIVAYGLAYRNKITRETLKSTTNQLASLLDQIEQCIKETHLPIDGIENLKGNFKATQRLLRNYPRLRWWNMSSYLLLKLVAAEKSLVRHISFHYLLDMARDLEIHGLTDILEGSNGEQKKEGDEILNPSDHEDTQNMGFQLMMIKHRLELEKTIWAKRFCCETQ
ncbi:putative disease resistance protein [Senna tora]|uniref:Putative disease resistance protein n=1 Tax=Senna tora TaxID=362788 RepID=A0A834T5D0_9FABA|nr:putative disease resistance protein [Senna tora]